MNKKQVSSVVVISVLLSLLINIFFGRFLSAVISTAPLLNRWKIISPQAPIVINTREEVRVSDTADTLKAVSLARPKLSGVAVSSSGNAVLIGGAVNLTSDGLFLSTQTAIAGYKPESLYIKLDDGTMSQVTAAYPDPATELVVLKTQLNNVAVSNINPSASLKAGERIIFLAPTLKNFSPSFQASFVAREQSSDYSADLDADKPTQSFAAQGTGALLPGQAVIDMSGNVIGLWSGNNIIAGDVLKDFANSFLVNAGKISRPMYGFDFRNISPPQASLQKVSVGAMVTKVVAAGAAQKAGLLANDIVIAVNDSQLGFDNPLNNYLQKFKPGDKVKLTVQRDGKKIDISITAGELK
jgi:S1-C subfamily serine protease